MSLNTVSSYSFLLDKNLLTQNVNLTRIVSREIYIQELEQKIKDLEEKNYQDSLTGVFNRGKFDIDLITYTQRVDRTGNDLSLLFIDIDKFKDINDKYGHQRGDKALISTAQTLQNILRNYEKNQVYRYGGDEFAILLPDTTLNDGIFVGERIRSSINSYIIDEKDKNYLSVSIGVANYKDNCLDPNNLVSYADKALYQAKQNGRNKVCVYSH